MRSGAREFEYAGYWLGRVANSEYLYACWWDDRARRTRRISLGTKVLNEAKDKLIALAGVKVGVRSPDAVLMIEALNFYYEQHVKKRPSEGPAFRAIQLLNEYLTEKVGPAPPVSAFGLIRQREFMRWSVEKYNHSSGTIARNLSVASAAFQFALKLQLVEDGFGIVKEVRLLDAAPEVVTQAAAVAEAVSLPNSTPRSWLPSYEEFGRFIDAIDVRQENLFRFVIIAFNTWARPEAIIDLRVDVQVNFSAGTVDLNPPGRRQQPKKYRPIIPLTKNLEDWLRAWDSVAPMMWDGQPITTIKKTFKRHAVECGFDRFTQDTIRHFMATQVRRADPPVSQEQRDTWLGHRKPRTASWYEHNEPDYLEGAMVATEAVITRLQKSTTRDLGARKSRARGAIRLISSRGDR